jgi:dTDP-3,4-didehydro-2,6-dideoxy-alpha-D-glucose 3-reductase
MIRIAILGTAAIAKKAIIPALHALPNLFQVQGYGSRREKTITEVDDVLGLPMLGSYADVVARNDVDAVYIPLPNALHAHWIEAALLANKHVLVEKPLACTLEDVVRLNQLAENKHLVLMENFQFRFHQQFAILTNLLQSGKIGEIRIIKSYFGFPPFADTTNIRYQKALGGGALFDAGVYPIKLAQILLGSQLVLQGAISTKNNISNVDIHGSGMLVEANTGIGFHFGFGFDNYYQCSVEVWGSSGKLTTNRIFTAPPGYKPTIIVETKEGVEEIAVASDNHYANMLKYFATLHNNAEARKNEYSQNIQQAQLIHDFKVMANG